MKTIPLTRGYEAMVSDEDYKYLSMWKYHCTIDAQGNPRAQRNKKKRGVKGYTNQPMTRDIMANELMDAGGKMVVDHVDRNTLNNRRSNLRVCTCQQNQWNRENAAYSPEKGEYVIF